MVINNAHVSRVATHLRCGGIFSDSIITNFLLILYALTSSNINRFSKLFHCQNHEKICNNTITKDPTTPQVCCYATL